MTDDVEVVAGAGPEQLVPRPTSFDALTRMIVCEVGFALAKDVLAAVAPEHAVRGDNALRIWSSQSRASVGVAVQRPIQ